MRFTWLLAVILVAGLLGTVSSPARADSCQFVLGFATLHDLIPQTVGRCLEDEHHTPANGDGLQMTTGGLLVWRKADNFTAFTDGFRTWVNGPFGLKMRLNSQRLFWEFNPDKLPIVPPPVPGDRCHTAQLSLSLDGVDGGAGNFVGTFRFTNNASVSCTIFGFVGAQLLDAQNNPLPTNVVRGGGFLVNEPPAMLITVPAGGSAIFRMHWDQVPVNNEPTCPTSSLLAITPADELNPIIIPD